MKLTPIISFIVIVSLITATVYYMYPNVVPSIKKLNPKSIQNLPEDKNISSEIQFMKNIRFNHKNISYSYTSECKNREKNMNLAFKIIENLSTTISFYEKASNADITISCSKESIEEKPDIFLAGEGGPQEIINLSINPLILSGIINLYEQKYEEPCDKPIVEIHELLHVFGYNHINNKSTLLYPYYHCDQQIPIDIIEHLDNLYSQEPKAELFFSKFNVTKDDDYLSYELEITNEGIISAENIILILKDKTKELSKTEMNDLKPGSTAKYSVKNLKLPNKNSIEITFEIKTDTEEQDTKNNIEKINFEA